MTRDRNAILRGTCPQHLSGSGFAAEDAAYGPLTIRRSYQPAAAGMPASRAACNTGVDAGKRAGRWSGKPSITAMADGDLDAQTLRFLWSILRWQPQPMGAGREVRPFEGLPMGGPRNRLRQNRHAGGWPG